MRETIDWRVPTKYAWKESESSLQVNVYSRALVNFTDSHPEILLLHAIPNGDWRGFGTGMKLKAQGVMPGIPDLFLPVPKGDYHGLYIELKKAGGSVKLCQWEIMEALHHHGYCVRITNQLEAAMNILDEYLNL